MIIDRDPAGHERGPMPNGAAAEAADFAGSVGVAAAGVVDAAGDEVDGSQVHEEVEHW